nr:hypothetical protein KitaXyl93_04320 [Kitasatospora sp. Xyl93]
MPEATAKSAISQPGTPCGAAAGAAVVVAPAVVVELAPAVAVSRWRAAVGRSGDADMCTYSWQRAGDSGGGGADGSLLAAVPQVRALIRPRCFLT